MHRAMQAQWEGQSPINWEGQSPIHWEEERPAQWEEQESEQWDEEQSCEIVEEQHVTQSEEQQKDDDEATTTPKVSLELLASLSLPSTGSTLHNYGKCKPCAWFWKPQGCLNGQTCGHCHLCPQGE